MLIITFSVLLVCFLAAIKFEQFCPLKSFFSTNIKASFAHFYHYTPPYLLVLHIPAYICVLIFIIIHYSSRHNTLICIPNPRSDTLWLSVCVSVKKDK